ncbi:zinc-binding dehydrogenase [Kitasatospora sp. NPDC093558]|uniref:quinone oxidoreductase family protein n=1 Tax=Kitasatospora sp. NPDC093558 TaxID=3155201 RepID=UPI00343DACE2
MRAWQVGELGEPHDVMKLVQDVPQPVAGPGQLLVRVRAAAVNFPDALMVRGQYQVSPPLPFTPGVEVCGEVVGGARRGERLIGNPVLPHGAFAEYALLDAAAAFPAPESLDDAEASALHIGYQTAWFALHRRARLRAGETLLVHGAAGGVGTLLLQFARARGINVVGTASEANHAHLRELGAIPVAYGDGLAERVRAAAPGGVHKVLDAVGLGGVLPLSIELAGGADRVLTIADFVGAEEHGVRFSGGAEGVEPYYDRAYEAALALHASGELRLPLHRVLPLAEAAEAHRVSEHGHLRGKIVLTV